MEKKNERKTNIEKYGDGNLKLRTNNVVILQGEEKSYIE